MTGRPRNSFSDTFWSGVEFSTNSGARIPAESTPVGFAPISPKVLRGMTQLQSGTGATAIRKLAPAQILGVAYGHSSPQTCQSPDTPIFQSCLDAFSPR